MVLSKSRHEDHSQTERFFSSAQSSSAVYFLPDLFMESHTSWCLAYLFGRIPFGCSDRGPLSFCWGRITFELPRPDQSIPQRKIQNYVATINRLLQVILQTSLSEVLYGRLL